MPNWELSVLAIAAAAYMAWLAVVSYRTGELLKFQPDFKVQMAVDLLAEISPEGRRMKYASRANAPVRFWICVAFRTLLAITGFSLSAYFLALSLS